MEVNFINSFIKAGVEIISQEVKEDVNRGNLAVGATEFTTEDLNILIGVVGQLEGQAFYCCAKETACKFVSVMAGETITQYNEMVADGMAELANVITGRATIYLEKNGYSLNLSPPAMIVGAGVKIGTISIQTINVPLVTKHGTLSIKVGLRPHT